MRVLVLLLVAVTITAACANSFLKNEEYTTVQERKQCMDGAIEEAIASMEARELAKMNKVNTQNEKDGNYTSSQLLNKFFKKPSEDAKKMGKANRLYRDIVNRAERKMFEVKRAKIAKTEGAEARAESLAEMLFHRPGSMLTSQEVARAWEVTRNTLAFISRHRLRCRFPTVNLYRTIDGTCNNIRNPLWGSSATAFRRLVPPSYEDEISSLRGSLQARKLLFGSHFLPPHPSPRFISETVVLNVSQDEIPFTHLLMQFGQFLDHDLDLGPEYQEEECEGCIFSDICQPIRVPVRDRSFGVGTRNNGSCLHFRRSVSVFDYMNPSQTVKPLEQLNDVTSFIDGSMIYGSRLDRSLLVRSFKDGLLREGPTIPMNQPSLPIDTMNQVACPNHMDCFLCGDNRCNEQISLTIMHTIWLREHNRCAREMTTINPHWDDEKLYQVCRKIVVALIQKITYEDYLPKVLGSNFYTFIGRYTGYDRRLDPSIPNSFATAAYRYGHSLIRPFFDRLDKSYQSLPIGPLNLGDAFFSPDQFRLSFGTDPIMRGWVSVNSRRMDEFMNSVLTTQLFQTPATQGLDLASLNLQRGRDHGLPSYLIYRDFCFEKFGITSDIENEITLVRFLQLYGTLETADVWLAGMAESRPSDGLLGATFACIFGLTFKGLREGDRFFWLRPREFTAKQRESISRDSISRVFCDNSDGITYIQPDAFLSNQTRVSCSRLGRVDLNLFREPACYFRAQMNRRASEREILIFSRSTQREYDFTNITIYANTRKFICIHIQCPTPSIATSIIFYSFTAHTTITPNQGLTLGTTDNDVYKTSLSISDFDNNRGLFNNNEDCESSIDVSFSFDIADTAPAALKAKLASESEDLPQGIMDELNSVNHDAGLESIEEVNSELLGNAEMEKKDEIKKTAALFVELEEALKKLN